MREKLHPQLIEVDPMRIKFNEHNPRKHLGTEFLRLKESVKAMGVIQEPTVRVLAGGFYECIDGEGRIRAAQEAGLPTIWVVSFGIIPDRDALTMLEAANTVRSFSYIAGCKGLADLHRQGQTCEALGRSLGVSSRTAETDVNVGYFPEPTLALIQNDLLHSDEEDLRWRESSSQEGRGGKRTLSWSAHTFYTLLPLRTQIKARGNASSLDGLYDYTEVHRAVEKIVQGEIATREQLLAYIERRRRELFEERFDQAFQMRLATEVDQTKQALKEAHEQSLQHIEEETTSRYETQIKQLQQQLGELETRHREIVKEVAKRPELVAKREVELEQKRREMEEERIQLRTLQRQIQEEAQKIRQQIEHDLKNQAEAVLKEQRAVMEQELKQAHADLEAYYAKRDQQRQMRVEKTFRQAIAHGTELLSQSHQWLLLLISPGMLKGLSWLQESELVSLLGQIRTVRETLEKAEEVVLHGTVSDAVGTEEGEVSNGTDDSRDEPPKNMG